MHSWLIIGSTAAYHWFGDKWHREPKDIDLLTPAKIVGNHSTVCVVDAQWHDAAELIIHTNVDKVFADPDMLYTLKVSHAAWDIHWEKTMVDIHKLQQLGCKLNVPVYERLIAVWNDIHKKKRVNLKQPVEKFFQDAVIRKYNHEELHELVAHPFRPMHERVRPDHSSVWCDQTLFNALSDDDKARVVHEELVVTAIERGNLISTSKNSDIMIATNKAYKLLCTSMTTGWFALYLITHRYNLLMERRDKWKELCTRTCSSLQKLTPINS